MNNLPAPRVGYLAHAEKMTGGSMWPYFLLGATLVMASVNAMAQSCTVASGGMLTFQSVIALASTGNQSTDSGQSFSVNCDSAVAGTLRLYSQTQRVMHSGAYSLPFNLSLNSGAVSNDLPMAFPGAQFNIARDGLVHPLTLYAKIFTQDFKFLPGGLYSASITLTVEY